MSVSKSHKEYYNSVGILSKYHEKTLDGFTNDKVAVKQVKNYLTKVKQFKSEGVGLYLYGANGTGKSHLMSTSFKTLIDLKYKVRIISFSDLMIMFTSAWYEKDAREIIQDIKTVHFLGIEEISKEYQKKENELARTVFDNVLRHRVQTNRPTWFTTNTPPEKIRDSYSKDIASMLNEAVIPVHVTGEDYRLKIADKLEGLI